jgi:hypothetical protein
MATRKPKPFSAVTAVKANARERLGTPKPGHALPSDAEKAARRKTKHKKTLADLLTRSGEE